MKAKEIIGNPIDIVEKQFAQDIEIDIKITDRDLGGQKAVVGCPKKPKKQILTGSTSEEQDDDANNHLQTPPEAP